MMSALCCAYGSFKAGRACAYNEDILRAVGHNRLVFRFGFVPDYRVKLTRSGLFEVYVCIAAVQAADAGSDIGKTAGLSLVWRFGIGNRLSAHCHHVRLAGFDDCICNTSIVNSAYCINRNTCDRLDLFCIVCYPAVIGVH